MHKQVDTGVNVGGEGGALSLDQAFALAIQCHQSGDLERAQIIYRSILDIAPNEGNALHFLGIAMHQSGDSASGIELMERSIAIDPQASRYVNFGKALLDVGRFEEAALALSRAIELDPANADTHNNYGVVLRGLKRFDEARAAFEKTIVLNPQHVNAYNNIGDVLVVQGRTEDSAAYFLMALSLQPTHPEYIAAIKRLGSVYCTLGELDKAVDMYQTWLVHEPDNPVARHHLLACSRESMPERAEDAYVESTFDEFADSFDEQLGKLEYRAPQLLAEVLRRECGVACEQFTILDAGCGTGLCGPLIVEYAAQLIGVDLSSGMLAKAQLRNEYDALIKAELTAYLQSQANAFDVILSADTLIYFGALEDVLSAAHTAIRDGGHLLFSAEAITADEVGGEYGLDYRLNPHGRYSHSEAYLRRTLGSVGFTNVTIETAIVRREGSSPVWGFIVSCRAA